MPPRSSVAGVGLDLVSIPRIRKFLKAHSAARVRRLLSPAEQKKYKKISPLIFAKLFTAKEAFFKSLGASWFGLQGFASMEVSLLSQDRFQIRIVEGPLACHASEKAEGSFFEFKDHVGAQVIRPETADNRQRTKNSS
jgi:phosphopantetheine--protein transferase-like protein